MTPDYHLMLVSFLVFCVAPLALVGAVALIRKARARGRRKFRDEPLERLRGLGPDTRLDHTWDSL
jgi:hypothetical protein